MNEKRIEKASEKLPQAASGAVTARQTAFLNAHKKRRRMITFMRVFLLILFLAVWELCSDLDVIDAFFFSSPRRVVVNFVTLLEENSLLTHIGVTLYETLLSFLLVFLISMICATVLWYSSRLSEILEPYLVVLNSLPKSALAPLLIVWLGTGMNTIIVAGMSVALFGAIISLYTGFRQVDEEKIRLIYTLGGSRRDALFRVVLPGSIPTILSTMKVNIGLALVGVIIGEFLAARRGLGYLIIYGSQVFKLDMVITSILILCVIAMGLYQVIQGIEKFYKKRL
ncbi:MAG TPA: ABC transporter permease [Candidatus Eisenbergiella merdavium]|uniref:ABC transporter permease n=1 Tax=Candidatus Eisenbergiella merdavium TaxID=2838551 RepID=A0A9D2NEQ8_9FIRM|nr:ABC transporter permease [Candidatus Eisenbergiella merdavium]